MLYNASFQIFIMGSARLSAVFILVPIFFKITVGQQFNLGNKQDCGPNKPVGLSDSGAQRLLSLYSNSQAASNNGKHLSPLQQYVLSKQNNQPSANAQQQQCGNVQSLPSNVNMQQSQPNTDHNSFYTLPLNLQRQILQQIQQLQSGTAVPGCQIGDQSSLMQPMSYGSLPMVNGQAAGLPTQVSQGVLLSNLGLTSSLPSLIPNACNCPQQHTEQVLATPQSNVVTNNAVTATPEATRFSTKFIPITTIPMANNAPAQTPCSFSYSLENCVGNQPQNEEQSTRVEQQSVPVQYQYQPVQQQMQGYQYAQVPQAILPQTLPVGVDPQALLTSYVLSQLGPSFGIPNSQYQSAAAGYQSSAATNLPPQIQGQKSSSLKTLVPLILNLLKEKEGCPCPNANNNCFSNNQKNDNDKPQVYQGYANQSNYGQPKRSAAGPPEGLSKNDTKQDSADKSNPNSNQKNSSFENDEEVDDRLDSYEDDVDD